MAYNRLLNILAFITLACCCIVSGAGLFYSSAGHVYEFINQHGDAVMIYGTGMYKNDSYFKAPILRGTDCTMLFIACPLLALALLQNMRTTTPRTKLFLTSMLGCFLYYATSQAIGVQYNALHLLYILLFSASLFGTITGISVTKQAFNNIKLSNTFPYNGMYIFLILTGIALIVAWLPDIVNAMLHKRALYLIENYTTEITYVLDMGIIAPLCFAIIYLLRMRQPTGYILADAILTLCSIIGVMIPTQTAFQYYEGITIPLPALITKVAIFCLLAIFAVYLKTRLLKAIK